MYAAAHVPAAHVIAGTDFSGVEKDGATGEIADGGLKTKADGDTERAGDDAETRQVNPR